MTCWHLLWMLVDVLGIAVSLTATPVLFYWCMAATERAQWRQYSWRAERRRRREIELYGQPLRPCLYCGSECEFGPNCANSRVVACISPRGVSYVPIPCVRCGKDSPKVSSFRNPAGQIFCGFNCYQAGGEA